MAIQDDNTILKKSDLKAYHEAIAPMLGGSFMVSTNNSDYYSTDEKVVGIWINGKPIYQKSFLMTYPEQTVEHNIVDVYLDTGVSIDEVIDVRGTRHSGSEAWTTNIHNSLTAFDTPSVASHLYPYVVDGGIVYVYSNDAPDTTRKNKIRLATTQNLEGQTTYITLQYTKTTDAAGLALTTPGAYNINFPNTWPENKEIFFGNGLYGYRAVGTANVTANRRWDLVIARNQPNAKIRSQGGGFTTHSNWFCPTPWHYESDGTFQCSTSMFVGNVENTKNVNYYIMSSSNGSLPYDVWVTYTK